MKDRNGEIITLGARVIFTPKGAKKPTSALVESLHENEDDEDSGSVIVRASHNETLNIPASDCVVTDGEETEAPAEPVKAAPKAGKRK